MKKEVKVYIDCFGCEIRQLDTQRIMEYIHLNEFSICSSPHECDFAIIITCAVSRYTENASIALINKVMKALPLGSKLLVGGCLPSISPELISQLKIDHSFSLKNINSLDSYFQDKITIKINSIKTPNKSFYDKPPKIKTIKTSAREDYDRAKKGFKIVISNGCIGECSYCMVKHAIGNVISKPVSDIINQLNCAIKTNENTIMLRGGDTGAYGIDINSSLPSLLNEILKNDGDFELFIHDCNINWLINSINEFEKVFRIDEKNKRLKAINFPIQSGSDTILRKMKRPYKSKDIISSLSKIRKKFPWISLGTHIMIGFPGETDRNFQKSMIIIKEAKFDFITCFPYSEHQNADSASLPNKISEEVIEKRLKIIKKEYLNIIKIVR